MNETANLLEIVLNGDTKAACLLAAEVHREISLDDINTSTPQLSDLQIETSNVGVWIDPIGNWEENY